MDHEILRKKENEDEKKDSYLYHSLTRLDGFPKLSLC